MNTQTKHTPGPWKINSDGDAIYGGRFRLRVARVLMPDTGAWDSEHAEQFDANARLIAASPDLLTACESALALLTDPTAEPGDADAVTAMLLTAIAKAKGEA